jgi:hypothetical protein
MADAAAYADERQIKLVIKPHGGGSGASAEIAAALQGGPARQLQDLVRRRQHHLLHEQDPVEELKPIAQHVTGFCAKDCGAPQGDVMISSARDEWTSCACSRR